MQHSPTNSKSSLGWLCPFSFASKLPSPDGGPVSHAAYLHECFHYQQLVTTPFGLHLALSDWLTTIGIAKLIQSVKEAGEETVTIPLLNSVAFGQSTEEQYIAVAEACGLREYANWLFHESSEIDEHLAYTLNVFVRAPLILSARMGNLSAQEQLNRFQAPVLPSRDAVPKIDEVVVSTIDILENCATVATDSFGTGAFMGGMIPFIESLSERLPPNYYHLIKVVFDIFDDGHYSNERLSVEEFSVVFTFISDLSFCGAIIPGMTGYGSPRSRWIDIHPSWRFARIVKFLRENKDIKHKIAWSSYGRGELEEYMDEVAECLGWVKPSEIHQQICWEIFSDLELPFTWGIEKYSDGIARRGETFPMPPNAGYSTAIKEFAMGDLNPQMSHEEYAKKIFARILNYMTYLAPPVGMVEGTDEFYALDVKESAYAIQLYYFSYFSKRIMFQNSLDYEMAFLKKDEIERLFENMFDFAPEQFKPFSSGLF